MLETRKRKIKKKGIMGKNNKIIKRLLFCVHEHLRFRKEDNNSVKLSQMNFKVSQDKRYRKRRGSTKESESRKQSC